MVNINAGPTSLDFSDGECYVLFPGQILELGSQLFWTVDHSGPHIIQHLAQLSSVLSSVLLNHHWDFICEQFFFLFFISLCPK